MKKIVALILALTMCLSLCACGGTAKTEDAIIGTWEYNFKLKETGAAGKKGDDYQQKLELYSGGTGKLEYNNLTSGEDHGNPSLTWEVEENIVNITFQSGFGGVVGLTYDATNDTLSRSDADIVYTRAE